MLDNQETIDNESFEDDVLPDDIETILQMVETAKAEGITPEQILDPDELELYNQYAAVNAVAEPGHYDNLVQSIDSTYVSKLAQEIVDLVKWDEETRKDWSDRESAGIRLLGVTDSDKIQVPFKGASTVTHPLLAEAIVQFHSRAMSEMWPVDGPVKTVVLGDKTDEKEAQAERVQDYMNYQYTEDMPGAFEEEDKLLFRLPLSGSCFKKVYYDPIAKKVCSRLVEPSDFIVPFSATDLASAPRYTHRYRESHNEVMKKLASKYYVSSKSFTVPNNEAWQYPQVKNEIDDSEGRTRASAYDTSRHTTLECYVELEIPGLEDYDEDGNKTGVAHPYIVWVNRDEQEVVRIQRNWKPNDVDKKAKLHFSHYQFMPGLGFYGYGLYHLIGGMAESATGSLRALLDSAAFYNMQGGFRTRDSRIKGGDLALSPGEWREIDSSSDELKKAFFQIPYKEPSQVLFNLLGYLDDRATKFVGTTDVMTGDANPNAPVGTTLALIEQGGKTFSAIHRRLHIAHKNEFRILARLNQEYLPAEGYPYYLSSKQRHIMPSDFDDRIDVIPVSDPDVISRTQSIIQAQTVLDLATKYPEFLDTKIALESMLKAIRVPDYKTLFKDDTAQQQSQAQIAQLQVKTAEAELQKILAEKENIDAEKTESVMRGIFAALQAAGLVASNPAIAPMGDEIFQSGGGKDYNGSPLVQQNTSPGFPANPVIEQPAQPELNQVIPESPIAGSNNGIETMETEPL